MSEETRLYASLDNSRSHAVTDEREVGFTTGCDFALCTGFAHGRDGDIADPGRSWRELDRVAQGADELVARIADAENGETAGELVHSLLTDGEMDYGWDIFGRPEGGTSPLTKELVLGFVEGMVSVHSRVLRG